MSSLTDEYLGLPEAAQALGVTEIALRGLLHERGQGGRVNYVKNADGTLPTELVPLSAAASLIPEPLGRVQTVVWRRAEIEAIVAEFKASRRKRG